MATKRLPKFPTRLPSHLGPIKVVRVKNLKSSEGEECHGIFHWDKRLIQIAANLEKEAAWAVLFHEYCHAVLADGGMDATLPYQVCESVCDLVGTSFTGLLRSGMLTPEQTPTRRTKKS